jgi:hypothetical protein
LQTNNNNVVVATTVFVVLLVFLLMVFWLRVFCREYLGDREGVAKTMGVCDMISAL